MTKTNHYLKVLAALVALAALTALTMAAAADPVEAAKKKPPPLAFGAKEVIDQFGSAASEGTYTSKGGTLIISASGSGFRSPANSKLEGRIGMNVLVDGTAQGTAEVFTNERDSHKAFVSDYLVVKGLPAGTHTIRLAPIYDNACNTTSEVRSTYCTTINSDDHFHVTVTELPA